MAAKLVKHTEYLKYSFSIEEKADIASELARANQSKGEVETKKKQVMDSLKSQLSELEALIHKNSHLYNNGYEYRDIECTVVFHSPGKGMKAIYRNDTGELVKEVYMTAGELQEKLAFEETEPAVEPEPDNRSDDIDAAHTENIENLPVIDGPEGKAQTLTFQGKTVPYPSPEADALMAKARVAAGVE